MSKFIILIFFIAAGLAFYIQVDEKASVDMHCQIKNKCVLCGNDNEILAYFHEVEKKYGSEKGIYQNLLKMSEDNIERFDNAFYEKYGAYVFSNIMMYSHKERIKALKVLLAHGVDPLLIYDKSRATLADVSIIYEKEEVFRLFLEQKKLYQCHELLKRFDKLANFVKNKNISAMVSYAIEKKRIEDIQ